MVVCLTSARFNMKADILRQGYIDNSGFNPVDQPGEWVMEQDKESGTIRRKWQENTVDNPATPDVNEAAVLEWFRCEARGILNASLRMSPTTERFGEVYSGIDYVKITFPANVKLSNRDRITNIRDKHGNIIWKEEEKDGQPATIFNVSGIIPIIDPFGKHIESFALLERAENQ